MIHSNKGSSYLSSLSILLSDLFVIFYFLTSFFLVIIEFPFILAFNKFSLVRF